MFLDYLSVSCDYATTVLNTKMKEVGNKITDLMGDKNSDWNTKLATLATKAELKAEQDEIMKLEAFDWSYFHGKFLFGDDGFQNVLIYQPTFNTLELKKRQRHWLCYWLEIKRFIWI